jgi:predicted permease
LYVPSTPKLPRILINVLKITLFPLGGFLIVAKDFEGPDVPSEEVRERMYLRRRRMVTNAALLLMRLFKLHLSQHPSVREKGDVEEGSDFKKKDTVSPNGSASKEEGLDLNTFTGLTTGPASAILVSKTAGLDKGLDQNTTTETTITPVPTISLNNNGSDYHHHDFLSRSWHFLKQLLKPCTVVIILSFVVSLVDPLKALFIPPSSNFQPHFRPTAPDGQPPLAFIFDTATFIGAACIPLGLICLGSALACLSLRSGGPFPKGAIASLALGKMVVIPIIGVAITRGFARVGFVHRDDKVLQFVCMCVVSSFSHHWHSLSSY